MKSTANGFEWQFRRSAFSWWVLREQIIGNPSNCLDPFNCLDHRQSIQLPWHSKQTLTCQLSKGRERITQWVCVTMWGITRHHQQCTACLFTVWLSRASGSPVVARTMGPWTYSSSHGAGGRWVGSHFHASGVTFAAVSGWSVNDCNLFLRFYAVVYWLATGRLIPGIAGTVTALLVFRTMGFIWDGIWALAS